MKDGTFSKETVSKIIKGVWHNPTTGNIWFFQDIFEDSERSIFSLRQNDGITSIDFDYRLIERDGNVFLELDGQLNRIVNLQQKILTVETIHGEIIILYKGYPKL